MLAVNEHDALVILAGFENDLRLLLLDFYSINFVQTASYNSTVFLLSNLIQLLQLFKLGRHFSAFCYL
jgi:hypothetical protein